MNFKLCRNHRNVNTASDQSFRTQLSMNNSTLNHSSAIFTNKMNKHLDFQTTNYQLFKRQEPSTDKNQIQVLKQIKIPPALPFPKVSDLNQIQFSSLSYSINHLIKLSKMMMDANPERKLIGSSFNLHRLIELIAENYQNVAYHNFSHAFSLMQALFQCYNRSDTLKKSIDEKQWLYVLISALAHDLNHPGTNNAFQVKAHTSYAVQAANQSVLEKMHLSLFWSLLRKNSQVNFLQGYSKNESNEIKKLITRLILATDVSKHFKGVQTLQNHIKSKSDLQGENSIVVLQQLFHACDISNPCLNFDSYINWSALVSHEFNSITVKEERLGLPITGFLKFQNMNKFYKGQIGFCNVFVLPLWRQLGTIFPGIEQFINNISSNVQKLQKKLQQTQ